MRVELSPSRVEVTVGESVVLSCKATHDTSLDVAFQWFFNQRPIAFQHDGGGGGGHFEFIQTVRARVKAKVRAREASSACLHVILNSTVCVCVRVSANGVVALSVCVRVSSYAFVQILLNSPREAKQCIDVSYTYAT